MKANVEIRNITSEDTLDLRQKILRPHQSREACRYPADNESTTVHWGAFVGEQLVSILSFYSEPLRTHAATNPYRIRGVATDPQHRRQGLATLLMHAAEQEAQKRSTDFIWFNARRAAYTFYEGIGYTFLSEEFEIEGIGPHKVMGKHLVIIDPSANVATNAKLE